jgi:predicted small integral membrane protein
MSSDGYVSKRAGVIVGAMIAALIVAGGVTILVLYHRTDLTSFYIAVAAVVLSPILLFAAYVINKRQQTSKWAGMKTVKEWAAFRTVRLPSANLL